MGEWVTRSPIELSWTAKKLKVGATLKVHLYAQVLGTETWAWPNLWRATSSGIGQFEVWQDRGHFVSEKGSQIRPPVLRIWCSETLTLAGGMFDPVVRIHPVMTGWFSWTCAWMFGHQDGIWDRGGRNGIVGIVGRGQTGGSRLLPTRVVREPLRANGLASVLTSDHLGTKQTYNPQLLPSINWEWFVYFPLQEWQKYKIITHTWGKTDWLKKTSFPGTENQRDVPQLALPFSSFDLGGLLPPLLSVHSKSRKEGIIFLWMQHGWTTTENHKTEIRSLSCVFGKPWHCLFAILTSLFPTAAPLVWMELHTQKHEFRLHFFLSVPTKEMSTFSKLR